MKESSIVDFRIRMHLLFLQSWHVHSYMFLLSIPPINSTYVTFTPPQKKTMSANYTIDIIVGFVVCLKMHYPKMSWFYSSQEFKPHPEHRRRGGLKVVSNWELQISMPCHLSFVRPFAFFGGVTNFETSLF